MTYHIYVHIPFCTSRCPYCYFTAKYPSSQMVRLKRIPAYVDALCSEISTTEFPDDDVRSIVFGGGTPSLLSTDQAERILRTIREKVGDHLLPDADVVYEIKPTAENMRKLDEFASLGFTRVSIGVQSFLDEELRILTRPYTGHFAKVFCQRARNVGYDVLNIDLLMSFPGQRLEEVVTNGRTAIELAPEQISLNVYYSNYPNSDRFIEMCRRAGRSVVSQQEKMNQYRTACALLAEAGYIRLDNTVFTQPGVGFDYNVDAIGEAVPIISFGPGSGAYWNNGTRYTPPDIEAYIAKPNPRHEPLTPDRHSFRLVWGQLNAHGVIHNDTVKRFFNADLETLAVHVPEVRALLDALLRYDVGYKSPLGFHLRQDRSTDAVLIMQQVKDQEFGYKLDTAPRKDTPLGG